MASRAGIHTPAPIRTPQEGEVSRRTNNPLLVDKPGKRPWNRLPHESPQHYEWFRKYRDMGTIRSGAKFAESMGWTSVNGMLTGIINKWEWRERAKQWDIYQLERQSEAENKAIDAKAQQIVEDWGERQVKLRERQYNVGYKLLKHVEKRLLAADGIAVDDEGNETEIEVQPMKLYDKDYSTMAKTAVALMAGAIAPPKQGISEDDEFANMPSDPSEWSEKDLLRYRAREEVG